MQDAGKVGKYCDLARRRLFDNRECEKEKRQELERKTLSRGDQSGERGKRKGECVPGGKDKIGKET